VVQVGVDMALTDSDVDNLYSSCIRNPYSIQLQDCP